MSKNMILVQARLRMGERGFFVGWCGRLREICGSVFCFSLP